MELEVKQQGPSNTVAALLAVAAIVLSVAAVAIANWLGLALLAVGIGAGIAGAGIGIRNALLGVSFVIRQRGEAQASIIRAQGETGQLEPPRRPELVDGAQYDGRRHRAGGIGPERRQ